MTIITNKPKVTFIHIPKNAGTSISQWLVTREKGKWSFENHHGGKHWTLDQMRRVATEDLGITFCCVRNPWDRLVSAFHYYKKQKKFNNRTFPEFIKGKDWHQVSKPQTAYFDEQTIILRYENLKEDFQQIQKLYGNHLGLPRSNRSVHGTFQKYYTDELVDIVAQRHKSDIERFGYKFE